MKYFIYCRKSTESEDRQLLSLPAQKRALDEYAQKEGLEIVDRFTESASAYKVGRPEFNKMVERLQDGEADAILVWQYNRIARNSLDGGMIIYMLDSGVIKGIRTPTGYTDGSGNSKFMLALEFAMSKKSSDDNSESVKRGNKEKVLRGWSIKKYSGYMFVEDPATGEPILANDPERFDLIKRALQMVINYKSPPKVLEILNDEWGFRTPKTRRIGGKPMGISNFYKVLHNEFYAGWIYTADGQRVRGKHEAMITDREYDQIQMILGYKGKSRPKTVSLPYRGLMQCGECGSAICLEEKYQVICSGCKYKFASRNRTTCPKCELAIDKMDDPTRLHYIYGACTKKKNHECTQKTIRIEALEAQIHDYLMSLEIKPKVCDWVLKQLKTNTEGQIAVNTQALDNLQKVVSGTQRELDGLLVQYTQPENKDRKIISTEAYMKRKGELEENKKQAVEKLADLTQRVANFMGDTEEKFNFAVKAATDFNTGDFETRTTVFRNLGQNLKLLDRKVLIDQDILHLFIRKANADIRAYTIDPLEPEKSIDIYEKTGLINPVISILQGWKESNLRRRFWRPQSYH